MPTPKPPPSALRCPGRSVLLRLLPAALVLSQALPGQGGEGAGAPAGIRDGSFEEQEAGAPVGGAWRSNDLRNLVYPVPGCPQEASLGLPQDGTRWLVVDAGTRPPAGDGPRAGPSLVWQQFRCGRTGRFLCLDVAFVSAERGEGPEDVLTVEVLQGGRRHVLLRLGTNSVPFPQKSCSGERATARISLAEDLQELFPESGPDTLFTLRIGVANGGDGAFGSRACVDAVRLEAEEPPRPFHSRIIPAGDGRYRWRTAGGRPGDHVHHLFTSELSRPLGSGPLFGIAATPEVLKQLASPLGTGLHHVLLGADGSYTSEPRSLTPGLVLDYVAVSMRGGRVVATSRPQRLEIPGGGDKDEAEAPLMRDVLPHSPVAVQLPETHLEGGIPPRASSLEGRLDPEAVAEGQVPLETLVRRGRRLFMHRFTRPEGYGDRRNGHPEGPSPFAVDDRIRGPGSSSCQDCHGAGTLLAGGPGDGAANTWSVFDPTKPRSVVAANERNTPALNGRAVMALLAREMSTELAALRRAARTEAASRGGPVTRRLSAKGVGFGSITAHPDGRVDMSAVRGVSPDLVVRPFSRKGASASLRDFVVRSFERHLGIQPAELLQRRGLEGGADADGDGVTHELDAGDVTAVLAWTASLPLPEQILPVDPERRRDVEAGRRAFHAAGCAACHVPHLELEAPVMPLVPSLEDGQVPAMDLTAAPVQEPRPEPGDDGRIRVALYSDLKRHDVGPLLADPLDEPLHDGNGKVDRELMLTTPLWDVGSSTPWLHHGRAVSLDDAIQAHGGEARASRDAYAALGRREQRALRRFLRTLRIRGDAEQEPWKPRVRQADVDAGHLDLEALAELGRRLWFHSFRREEGYGDNDHLGPPSSENAPPLVGFNRIRGPDANNCQSCHGGGTTILGGPGGNAMNVVVITLPTRTTEVRGAGIRNTPPIHGLAWIELLAAEMSADLRAQRDATVAEAARSGRVVERSLASKGVFFGRIRAVPEGPAGPYVDTSGLQGVSPDLQIRPFHAKGVLPTIRAFTFHALNRHNGVEAMEWVENHMMSPGTPHMDRDEDGVTDEATYGDLTALTVFQARFPVPVQVWPEDPRARSRAHRGQELFRTTGCADCHRPELVADSSVLHIPSPRDPERALELDLASEEVPAPRLAQVSGGGVPVPLYGDLKRHDMGPALADDTPQKVLPDFTPDPPVPLQEFLTTELWGVADTGPYMHHGRATTLDAAIRGHGGEAAPSRAAYLDLPEEDRESLLAFLRTLRLVPPGSGPR